MNFKGSKYQIARTNDPKHDAASTKQVQNWYDRNICGHTQLIWRENFAKQYDGRRNFPYAIIAIHHETHYNQYQWRCDPVQRVNKQNKNLRKN